MAEARVLLSIDFEPWTAFLKPYETVSSEQRYEADQGYCWYALEEILPELSGLSTSIYLVGEIVNWHNEFPRKIIAAGHELGFHCHSHRSLFNPQELQKDCKRSESWLQEFRVKGYRAPFVTISYGCYSVLSQFRFQYSSSIYAPTGLASKCGNIWEVPVSTLPLHRKKLNPSAPRQLSFGLLSQGELPYGSSFFIGLLGEKLFPLLEKELKAGKSPVIILHSYQISQPPGWPKQIQSGLRSNLALWPFAKSQKLFLKHLIRDFPIGSIGGWLEYCWQYDEVYQSR